MTHFTTGSEKQIAYAEKMFDAAVISMLAHGKADDATIRGLLASKTSTDASLWIDAFNKGHFFNDDGGVYHIREFLVAVSK